VRHHAYPSTIEAALNCVNYTGTGDCVDVVRNGILIDAALYAKVPNPLPLTSPERMERIVKEQAEAKARTKARVAAYAAEFAGGRVEPNVISLDEYIAEENAGDYSFDDWEEAA